MKKRISKKISPTKLTLNEYIFLGGLLFVELFFISTSLIFRDLMLTAVVQSNTSSQNSILLEGSSQQIFPNTESNYIIKANPDQVNSTVATIRLEFNNATVISFEPEQGFLAFGVCEGGKTFTDNKVCVDIGSTTGPIVADEKIGEVTLKFGSESNFSVVTADGNGFYNGQNLSLNENTTMAFDGNSFLPMTGDESTSFDLTNYPLFIGISVLIILGGSGGLLYLILKKDSKVKDVKVARIATVAGILVLAGGTVLLSLYIENNKVSVENSYATALSCTREDCTSRSCCSNMGIECNSSTKQCVSCLDKICSSVSDCCGGGQVCEKKSATDTNKVCLVRAGTPLACIPDGGEYYNGECYTLVCAEYCCSGANVFYYDFERQRDICGTRATPTPTLMNTATPKPTNTITPTTKPGNTATPKPTDTITPTTKPGNTATPRPTNTITPTTRPGNTATPRPTNTVTPRLGNTSTPAPIQSGIACGHTGCSVDPDCAGYVDNKQEGSATCDQVIDNDLSKQRCVKLCKYGYVNGDVCTCVSSPQGTLTPAPTSTAITCGPMDYNSDKILNYIDMYYFLLVYNKTCSNDPSPSWGCGGQDSNDDRKIDYIDNYALMSNYYPKVTNCTGMPGK